MKLKSILPLLAAAWLIPALTFGEASPAKPSKSSPSKPAKPQVILLKLDDVVAGKGHEAVPPRWQRITDFIEQNNLKAGFGIIGWSLEADNPIYFNWLKEHQKKGAIEFWCHGYRERLASDKNGEFEVGTAAEQQAIFEKCERLAKEKLGFTLPAFGPHWSGTTEATEQALQAVPEIKFWLYSPAQPKFYKKFGVPRVMALENPTFVPDFAKFQATYERVAARQPVLVLQGHANQWDDTRWAGFLKIIDFLKSKGCVFMTPSEYMASVEQK